MLDYCSVCERHCDPLACPYYPGEDYEDEALLDEIKEETPFVPAGSSDRLIEYRLRYGMKDHIRLNISYAEKETAKKHNARWDSRQKYWYIPDFVTVGSAILSVKAMADELKRSVPDICPDLCHANIAAFTGEKVNIREEKRDLFSVSDDWYLAHCISADYALGAGIAKQFDKRFDMKVKLAVEYPHRRVGSALFVDRVFNLVTKEKYWEKPTYRTLAAALEDMALQMKKQGIRQLAIPKIGCGLDKLDWRIVRSILERTFYGMDVQILVCRL